MSNQILVPSLGESVTEATVSKWLKQVGEKVDSDEPLVELETDKVNVEVPSPLNGILTSIKVKEGDTVEVGALLGIVNEEKSKSIKENEIETEDQSTYIPPNKSQKKQEVLENLAEESKNEIFSETLVLENLAEENIEEVKEVDEEESYIPPKAKKNLSPSVRKIVKENNIDLSNIEGTGKEGRISKGDIINLMGNEPEPLKRKITHGEEERVKMSRLRLTIAKRLKESQNNAAMLTTYNEVSMHSIIEMRKNYQEDFQKKYGIKLGYMSFFVKATTRALQIFPVVNSEIDNDHIVYKNYYNVSIAISTNSGLVTPVLKKADELSFANIEKNIVALTEKARQSKITINDLQGGSFTITNGGIFGSLLSSPIINPPQSGILAMHAIKDRAVVENGQVIARPMMYLALSYDHRIIDGKEAVSFLKTIKEYLEEPRRLFLDL